MPDGRIALMTGADSGIGRVAAQGVARRGADAAIDHLHDADGAAATEQGVENAERRAHVARADTGVEVHARVREGRGAPAMARCAPSRDLRKTT